MDTPTPRPTPTLTRKEIQHIRHQMKAACAELSAMLGIGGDLKTIWDQPRRYFVPEIGTCIPFPKGHLCRLVEPMRKLPEPTDPIDRALWDDITASILWLEVARREIIPGRFKNEEDNKAPDSERSSCFW